MAKWDYLIESDADLRALERAALSGGLSEWVRYRKELIRKGRDFTGPLFDLVSNYQGCRDRLFREMFGEKAASRGCKYDIPKNLSLVKEVDGYVFRVTPSTSGGGAGSRVKWQCPMCHAWVGATVRVIKGHLNRKDHKVV